MRKHRIFPVLFAVLWMYCLLSGVSWSLLSIRLVDPNANFVALGSYRCERAESGSDDDCTVVGYLERTISANDLWPLFDDAWDAWNESLPESERWTKEGGDELFGRLYVTTFTTYNLCPSVGGVTVEAYYAPADNAEGKKELEDWCWCQAVFHNYLPNVIPDHDSPTINPPLLHMDVSNEIGHEAPPLYPYQYVDGSFHDHPNAYCQENSTVFFDGIALLCKVDYENKILTAYEGFSYGWKFFCYPLPEPASVIALFTLGLPIWAIRLRARRKMG